MFKVITLIIASAFSLVLALDKPTIAVMKLSNAILTENEATAITNKVCAKLFEIGTYTVVERAEVDKILKEQAFQNTGCTDASCAVEIGQILNVKYTVVLSVDKIGSTYSLVARIVDVGTAQILSSTTVDCIGLTLEDVLIDGIPLLVSDLVSGKNSDSIRKISSKQNTTASLDSKDEILGHFKITAKNNSSAKIYIKNISKNPRVATQDSLIGTGYVEGVIPEGKYSIRILDSGEIWATSTMTILYGTPSEAIVGEKPFQRFGISMGYYGISVPAIDYVSSRPYNYHADAAYLSGVFVGASLENNSISHSINLNFSLGKNSSANYGVFYKLQYAGFRSSKSIDSSGISLRPGFKVGFEGTERNGT